MMSILLPSRSTLKIVVRLPRRVVARAHHQGLIEFRPVRDRMAVDRLDHVAHAQAGLKGGTRDLGLVGQLDGPLDIADQGAVAVVAFGHADPPDDAGEQEGKQDVEGGPRGEDDHLRRIGDRGQVDGRVLAFALHGAEVSDLRQEDVTS